MFLVLMEALVHQKKIFNINSSKAKTNFFLSLHYNSDNSYLFVKENNKFKASIKNDNFPSRFCLGCIPNKFDYMDSEEVSLKKGVYDFSVY